jgi:hypothetical protein
MQSKGIDPLVSFAAGGLAETWTGGGYPFSNDDLREFPFGYESLASHYGTVAARIGITGVSDDLAQFMPLHDGLLTPLELDLHSARLLNAYERRRENLNSKQFYLGRSRSAVLSQGLRGREACDRLGRCLWGCPTRSFYTPSITLDECIANPNFRYLPGHFVTHFRFNNGGRVTSVVSTHNGAVQETPVGTLVLGGGTLGSSAIFLNSIHRDGHEPPVLKGLMDNRQVMMPFVNLSMLGRRYEPRSYQYHQLAIGVPGAAPRDYVHGLITTLKTALVHPLVQSLPFHLRASIKTFRDLHAALGLININFSDSRRDTNQLAIDVSNPGLTRLLVQYEPGRAEQDRIATATRILRSAVLRLGCLAPPSMTRQRPMGSSVHYAGTIPMSAARKPLTCSPQCRSHDFGNLYFVDGTSLPDLPAKNLTFTLMANAVRVAESEF